MTQAALRAELFALHMLVERLPDDATIWIGRKNIVGGFGRAGVTQSAQKIKIYWMVSVSNIIG